MPDITYVHVDWEDDPDLPDEVQITIHTARGRQALGMVGNLNPKHMTFHLSLDEFDKLQVAAYAIKATIEDRTPDPFDSDKED